MAENEKKVKKVAVESGETTQTMSPEEIIEKLQSANKELAAENKKLAQAYEETLIVKNSLLLQIRILQRELDSRR